MNRSTTNTGNHADYKIPNDSLGAFCRENHQALPPLGKGALDGLSFAAKDVMDVAGSRTGFGQPSWLATQSEAVENAEVVTRLLKAGAHLLGKTVTDELSAFIQPQW